MASVTETRATLDDLYRTEGKAELIGGRIVPQMATGVRPNKVAGRIYRSLSDHADRKGGHAFTDNMGFAVPELPSGRESFSPDASFYDGSLPEDVMRFVKGPPKFAAEVRSANDYGQPAEDKIADKRDAYFLAGTEVVWDVDPKANCIHAYRRGDEQPITFVKGQMAHAEPAVPGWSVSVDWLFAD